eukprot:1465806-Rhodomonas_salina.1
MALLLCSRPYPGTAAYAIAQYHMLSRSTTCRVGAYALAQYRTSRRECVGAYALKLSTTHRVGASSVPDIA